MVFHLFSMLYYVRIEKSPYILIVIRFNVNRFQCYSMLIQKNIATIFSRSLEFCSWKMRGKLISQVFICYTPSKYQAGAVLRPIPMLIFLNFIRGSRLVVCTCYFDRCPFVNQWVYLKVCSELAYLTLIRSDASLYSIFYVFYQYIV